MRSRENVKVILFHIDAENIKVEDGVIHKYVGGRFKPCTYTDRYGYVKVGLKNPFTGGYITTTGHLVAWLYYHGWIDERTINHLDENKTNNREENLELLTMGENVSYSQRGRKKKKLSIEQVQQIKRLLNQGHSPKNVALEFDVSGSCIKHIKNGKTWVNV